ncbi:membrane protein [Vibrio tubiashii]|nr:membrane protein [Vibrio tubiashii]
MHIKSCLVLGGIACGAGVALGAFAAHGLKQVLSPYLLDVFQTGVQYQFIHGIAILLCGVLLGLKLPLKSQKYFSLAAVCFIIGIFCFSGSLYALALTGIKWFGPITPFGGLTFMLGWGLFVYAALQVKEVNQ